MLYLLTNYWVQAALACLVIYVIYLAWLDASHYRVLICNVGQPMTPDVAKSVSYVRTQLEAQHLTTIDTLCDKPEPSQWDEAETLALFTDGKKERVIKLTFSHGG
jgi:hypothetical protein